jgi:hypothetical protein
MHIWDFESLSVLYHVLSPFPSFRILNFTSDGSSVVDVMDSGMRIWSPAVLVRKNAEEDASISDDAIQLAITEGEYESRKNGQTTALCAHPMLSVVLAGKYNGQVMAFSTKGDKPATVLYSHSQTAFVTELAIGGNSIIASCDVTGVVQVWKLLPSMMKCDTQLAAIHITAAVKQLCFSADGDFLLVATTKSDCVYHVKDGSIVGSWNFEVNERTVWRWLPLPRKSEKKQPKPDCFVLLADGVIRYFDAASFPALADHLPTIHLEYSLGKETTVSEFTAAVINTSTQTLALEVRRDCHSASALTTFLFNLNLATNPADENLSSSFIRLSPFGMAVSEKCARFIGFSELTKTIVFLHRNSWLSSVDLQDLDAGKYVQHFFVPTDYLSSNDRVAPVKTVDDDTVFCLHGELISVRNGLKFREVKGLV